MYNNIPKELKLKKNWVCWRVEERAGKPTKVPVNAKTGGRAMANNPDTWTDFNTAVEASRKHSGIGYMFSDDDIVGIDLDGCRDEKTGQLNATAVDIIQTIDSYTEISQSGKGIHIICKGSIPGQKRRKGSVEIYENLRFFIMTGHILDDGHTDIEERNKEIEKVYKKYIDIEKVQKKSNQPSIPLSLSDSEVIEKAMNAKNGTLFTNLMNGNWQGLYSSQSEADISLCNILAFWTQRDPAAMDRIFRQSGLYREKWNERRGEDTYGNVNIASAIKRCDKIYETPSPRKIKKDKKESKNNNTVKLPKWITGPYNDTWNSQRMVEGFGQDILYNCSKGCWYIWNGRFWEEDRLGSIRGKANQTISQIIKYYKPLMREKYGVDNKVYANFIAWLARSKNTSKLDNMLKETQYTAGIATLPEHLDMDDWVLCCENGTIDLKTGKLREHRREDKITRMCHVKYDPDATAPVWDSFLDRIFGGDKELIAFMQRAIGYSFTGSTREQAVFVCYGSGANGKSTLIGTIQEIMGDYAKNTNFTTFMVRNDSNTNDIARLLGARFVTAMEVGEDKRLNEALIKQLTGGDKISARFLHKEFFDYIPKFKIWMGSNHKPKVKETDLGIWRRLKLIPFDVVIPEKDRDKDLPEKLKKELPGILSWIIKGCLSWQKQGLNPPTIINSATNEYKSEMDVLQSFLDECTITKENEYIKAGELYQVYERWCTENGEYKISSTKFALKIKERGFKKERTNNMRFWSGIKLSDFAKKLRFGAQNFKNNSENYKNNDKNDTKIFNFEQEFIPYKD